MSKNKKPSNYKSTAVKQKPHKTVHKQKQVWKWIGIGFVLVVIISASILLISKQAAVTNISPAQAYEKFKDGAFFLDVRSQDEWNQAHIANSVNIPLDELQNHLNKLPDDRDIVVVCLIGKRSQEGMTILRNAGFSDATCMTGGLKAWKSAGYPLEGSNP
jgi:rhodanese-related sulfurtransferase